MKPMKLKDMSIDEQKALVWSHHKGVSMEYWNSFRDAWLPSDCKRLYSSTPYRLSPSKPSINWDHVGGKWNYLAVDDGYTFLYSNKPEAGRESWCSEGNCYSISTGIYASYNSGDCSWEDSLIQR